MFAMLHKHEGGRGQTLVEFALIAPIFFLIVFGLIDGGRAIYAYSTVANAARVGARAAIVNQDPVAVRDAAVAEAVGLGLTGTVCGADLCGPDITYVSCAEENCTITVTVSYDYEPVAPMLGAIFNPTIESTAEMVIERVNP